MDHPRSRGVYRRHLPVYTRSNGSSPLARGLQDQWVTMTVTDLDHPRSRGVYLAGRPRLPTGPRIIPARAGFTPESAPGRPPVWDHPRSRGVYGGLMSELQEIAGSSPLARGLPRRSTRTKVTGRIIPARAGFTGDPIKGSGRTPDHPRSRGVYHRPWRTLVARPGSSPLARGLRSRRSHTAQCGRIIPARAGFTGGDVGHEFGGGDHPRSRGVYDIVWAMDIGDAGSSPLARGLPARQFREINNTRIIPARAGFTP